MDITIKGSDFARIVADASRATGKSRKNNTPILEHILLTADGATLSASGTDLEIAATSAAPCEVTAPGALVLPAKEILKAARAWKKQSISIRSETTGDETTCIITHDMGVSRYVSEAVSDFPKLSAGDLPHSITMTAERLLTALDQVSYAIISQETWRYPNGVYLTARYIGEEFRLEMVATDGDRLARHVLGPVAPGTLPVAANGANGFGVTIPRIAVKAIAESIAAKMGDVRIDLSESRIRFACGGLTILSKTVDGCYPDYVRVMPREFEQMTICESADFSRAVTAMQQAATSKNNPVKVATNGAIVMSTASATVSVPGKSELDHHETGFQGFYLADLAKRLSGTVTMRLDKSGPGLFTDQRGMTDHVIMPLRVY